jgi:hypothetical protein
MFSAPVETTLNMLMQEASAISKRVIQEDRPDLISDVAEFVSVACRLAQAFKLSSPVDPASYVAELKKRFLLATTLSVVAGIFTDDAVAAPIDPNPLRRNSQHRLGVGLADHRQAKVAIDAPVYRPDCPCYGFIVPAESGEEWYMVRESGDTGFVLALEHEWIRGYGTDMVVAREVLGLGREAAKMAEEVRPGIRAWIEQASSLFHERYANLPSEAFERGIPSFYHFEKKGFSRQPWGEIEP